MKKPKPGKRHILLSYQREMGRLLRNALGIAMLLIGAWLLGYLQIVIPFSGVAGYWLLGGGLLALAFFVFALLARKMTYVQAYPTHVRVATPFFRLNISYRRVRSVRPANLVQMFPPQKIKKSLARSLEPFYGRTGVVVELNAYPLDPTLLRLFLPAYMFPPDSKGLLFIVDDWMGLSTDLDTLRSLYSHHLAQKARA